jgi:hypothetical protein
MKVIFLDIDGVLNVYCQSRDKYGCNFHQHLVDNLQTIIDATDAKIVISSSWRVDGIDIMRAMWDSRKLPGTIIDVTPDLYYTYSGPDGDDDYSRGDEIQLWLDSHYDVTDYVILDDDNDMLPNQMKNFVQTNHNLKHPDCVDRGYGLTKICADKAIKILNNGK